MKNKFILLSYVVILLLPTILLSQKTFVSIGIGIVALFALYIFSIIIKLGLHQRLPLALGKISIQNIPDRAAKKYGNQILFTADEPCSWDIPALQNEYPDKSGWSATQIKSVAGYLAKMLQDFFHLKGGERIAILKQNHFDIHLFMMAIVRAGGIACPINGKFESINIEPYLSNIGSKLLITDYATLNRLLKECNNLGSILKILLAEKRDVSPASEINNSIISFNLKFPQIRIYWIEETLDKIDKEADAIPRSNEDILYLVHSSGTTGFPKAVILQNGPQSYAIRGWLCYVHVSRKRDKAYLAVPNNHQAVILSFNSMLLLGLRVHWTSSYDYEDFNSDKILKELEEGNYTGFFGFPIAYTQIKERLEHSKRLRKIRFWASTADASHEAIIKPFVKNGNAFKSLGIPVDGSIFLDAQGSSEVGTPSVLRYYTPFTGKYDRRIGKPGSTPFGPKVRITKLNGEPAKVEEPGRLEVKGKTVFRSYWNNPKLTQKSFTKGWFFTGDIVRMNKKKSIIQLDREVDVIHSATGDIFTLPIEEKIHNHPAVFDACVYGALLENGYQLTYAAIALKAGFVYNDFELLKELNQLLSTSEQLHRCDIIRWDEFPFGVTGKTLKRVFRERSKKLLLTDSK
jgi:long-chain acyl-CoA synthetase